MRLSLDVCFIQDQDFFCLFLRMFALLFPGPLNLLDDQGFVGGTSGSTILDHNLDVFDASCSLELLTSSFDRMPFGSGDVLLPQGGSTGLVMNGPESTSVLEEMMMKRPVGRPRTGIIQHKGLTSRTSSGTCGSFAKKRRGPKPKYVYSTPEEAAFARKERNRKSALASYYRRRGRIEHLENEKKRLAKENEALEKLLAKIKCEGGRSMLCKLDNDGINDWLRRHGVEI